jgi:hypothetical protein
MAPLRELPQDSQWTEWWLEGRSCPASHKGQTKKPGLDARDEPFISYPFLTVMSYSESPAPRNSDTAVLQARLMCVRPERGLSFACASLARRLPCASCCNSWWRWSIRPLSSSEPYMTFPFCLRFGAYAA